MSTVTIELERELVNLLHHVHGCPEDTVKEYLVLELYRRREVSSGRAAELLAMERAEFIRYASRLGISFLDVDERELREEIARVRGEG